MNTGGAMSSVHVTVLPTEDVLPHASDATNLLVCDRLHPVLFIAPSDCVTLAAPHASVAVAEPSAAVIAAGAGLHPKFWAE